MSNLNVFNQSWNEIVFEGRNKEYGAFQLRQESPKTTLKALFFGTLLCASLVSIPFISSLLKEDVAVVPKPDYVLPDVVTVNFDKTIKKEEPKKEAAAQPEKSSAKEKKYVTPIISEKPTTPTETPILDFKEPIKTGAIENPGDNQGAIALGQGTIDGQGKKPVDDVIPSKGEGGGKIFNNYGLDSSPEFPGGIKKFIEIVGAKFKTPEVSDKGVMRVIVSFVVETDGSLSNINVARDPGFGLGNEAIRVLKSIKTKWKPGVQNGANVRVAYNLPISVVMKN